MTPLSPHFMLEEMISSQTAARRGIEIVPPPEVVDNLKRLCVRLLEPIRITLQRPIIVSSGYRPPWLNAEIGGAANSAHLTGRAADINAVGMPASVLAAWIRKNGFAPDKCILEFGQWVHIQDSEKGSPPRAQYLTASRVNNQTIYEVMA